MSNITARDLKKSDIEAIDEIWQRNPAIDVPDLKNMIINAVIEDTDTGKILAYGAVKIFAEAILLLDKELSKQDKALAVMEAMRTAIVYSKDAGLEYIFAVAADDNFANVLENRYKFRRIPGTLLRLDLSDIKDGE